MKRSCLVVLAAMMLLLCAACGEKDTKPDKTVEDTRETLVEQEWNGLVFYLGRYFTKTCETENTISFTNGLMDYELSTWALNVFEDDASSSQKFANQYIHMLQDQLVTESTTKEEAPELDVEVGNDNGIYYAVIEYEEDYLVCGFYVDSNYGWLATIRTEDYETYRDSILNYLTIGRIVGTFDPSTASNVTK